MLACSTPVPISADTQYLSLGTPELTREDALAKEMGISTAFPYENHKPLSGRRSASTELPPPEREKNVPPVRRASSFKRKDTSNQLHSPKYDRYKKKDGTKSPTKIDKLDSSVLNGAVVKRQRSLNKRPRTFHPDIFDNLPKSTSEVPSPTPKEIPEPKSPRRKTLSGTLSRMFGRDKEKEEVCK